MRLNHEDRMTIRWYVDKVMLDLNNKPNKTSPYGYGTLKTVAETFIEWGKKYGHTYWSTQKGITTAAMTQRVKGWCDNESINSFNKADAEWICETIRMKFDEAGSAHTTTEPVKYDPTEENHAYIQPLPVVPEITGDITLDGMRDMAMAMRRFTQDVYDAELVAIMADAELKLLRLLADRL